jgi:hypothetical protein
VKLEVYKILSINFSKNKTYGGSVLDSKNEVIENQNVEKDKINEKKSNNCFFVGGDDWIENKNLKKEEKERYKSKIKLFLKKYLLLDNVNFLFGTGSSIHLGAESIQEIPKQISDKIEKNNNIKELFENLKKKYEKRLLLDIKEKIEKRNDCLIWENKINNLEEELKNKLKEFKIENEKVNLKEIIVKNKLDDSEKEEIYKLGVEVKLEDFLNYLYALKYLMEQSEDLISKEEIDLEKLEQLIETIKKAIFEMCDIDKISFDNNHFLKKEENKKIKDKMKKEGKYTYHKSLLTSLLQRPLNLRRANIFTLNYDLAFEYACDELGIEYINGFVGFNERNFRPEVYNYDFFFPGDTTEGKVRRIERVIKYYKLHGSLNWVYRNQNKNNPYGLYEIPIELVRMKLANKMDNLGDIMIYPTSSKKEYTLNFPYSELFRKFADRLQQPEAVLFVVGYSFYDEHVNDIIYQALANPSFTLIIVDFKGTQSGEEIKRLNDLKDPRIIICQGEELGDFKYFSKELLPTIDQEDTRAKVMSSLEKLYQAENDKKQEE